MNDYDMWGQRELIQRIEELWIICEMYSILKQQEDKSERVRDILSYTEQHAQQELSKWSR